MGRSARAAGWSGQAWWVVTKRVWECKGCRGQFTVTAGTPMHRTHLPLLTWLHAMWLISASSKGISAMKLAEWLGCTYQTAWHLGHRIRAMMAEDSPMRRGVVELDEMFGGAPPRKRAKPERDDDESSPPPANPKGRGTKRPLVLVVAERGGKVDARVIPTHGKAAIAGALDRKLDPEAVVMTNGLPAYKHLGDKHTHLAVNHSQREYTRTDKATGLRAHVNMVEAFNSTVRRAVIGVFHFVSVKHLGRYASEAAHRWNHRRDGGRTGPASRHDLQRRRTRPALRLPDGEGGLMARKKPEHPPVHRTDLLPSNLTVSKEAKVLDLLAHYRDGAVLLGREQWRLFFETGRFNKNHDVDKVTFAAAIGAANRVQMCRYQVVGQLQGWVSNRTNEFRDTVTGSSLPPGTKYMLHVINRMGAWFLRGDIAMKETGEIIPPEVRKLARSIMRHVMGKHRRPNLSRISMRLDHRAGCIAASVKATQGGKVGWWISMSTMESGKKIAIPLLTYKYHAERPAAYQRNSGQLPRRKADFRHRDGHR